VSRGKVTAVVSRKRHRSRGSTIRFDAEVARQYMEASKELARMLRTDEVLSLNVLAGLDGVFCEEESEEDLAQAEGEIVQVLAEALDRLDAMRESEGRALVADIRKRIALMRDSLAAIEHRLPELNALYETRLRERIGELTTDLSLTEERIAIEVAIMAEKSDVTEEVVRLKSHLDHVEESLDSDEPMGRRLDFMAQEIQREVNTLGVKTRDADVAQVVLDMKAELGKIREQVQNIE